MPSETEYKICPFCHEVIDYLNYNQDVTEYGDANLEGEITKEDGTDNNGDIHYFCPQCRDEIEDISELTDVPEEEEKVEQPTEPIIIETPSDLIQETYFKDVRYRICPNCRSRIDIEDDNKYSSIKCYTCKKILNDKNSKIMMT